ncbi:nSTAND1 domain-containing NTPase [Kitasatospora sp. NBC_01302]|uniref:nSTAND1 domain-containing NTPase n=1 Tax=Kitasatospora sp. NBC_01302 TaxID=2903575 RepID=UPI002E0DC4A5|nr:hypothetical protein OG294_39310 [Kitasatospora sp. NBC_01302]
MDGPVPADRTIGLGGRPQPVPDRTTGRGSPEQVRPTIEHGMGESGVLAVISRMVFGFLPSRRLRLPLVKRQPRQPGQSRRLFTQLVRVPLSSAGATRRRVPRAELSEHQWQIAQRLATIRMLVIDGSQGAETVELAHEALIAVWDELAAWTAEDRKFLVWRESLQHDTS